MYTLDCTAAWIMNISKLFRISKNTADVLKVIMPLYLNLRRCSEQ